MVGTHRQPDAHDRAALSVLYRWDRIYSVLQLCTAWIQRKEQDLKVVGIAFSSYPATDLKRACRFHEGALGLNEVASLATGETGFVEYDIGPGRSRLGTAHRTGSHRPAADRSAWRWTISMRRSRDSERAAVPFNWPLETPVCHMERPGRKLREDPLEQNLTMKGRRKLPLGSSDREMCASREQVAVSMVRLRKRWERGKPIDSTRHLDDLMDGRRSWMACGFYNCHNGRHYVR